MEARTAYARLVQYPTGNRQWVIDLCPYCGQKHFHGAGLPGENPSDFLGDRCAHCVSQESRIYVLEDQTREH
jgi:hypothetical protein